MPRLPEGWDIIQGDALGGEAPVSYGMNIRRKASGIAFTATLLASLIAVVAAPITDNFPATPPEINGHCPPADPIQVFPQPAPNPSS